jgi:hypothetical protein
MLLRTWKAQNEVVKNVSVSRFEKNGVTLGLRGRVENTHEVLTDDGSLIVSRECITGNVAPGGNLEVKDYVNVSVDRDSGDIVDFSMRSDWSRFGVPSPIVMGTNDVVYTIDDLSPLPKNAMTVVGADIKVNLDLPLVPDWFEDSFQVNYLDTAGAVLSFFTTINLIYPYELHVMIDTDKRIEVLRFESGNGWKNRCETILRKTYMPILARLFIEMREQCRKEGLHLLIFVLNYPFGTYVRIKNKIEGGWITFNLNASENSRVLMTNEHHASNTYFTGQLFHELCKTGVPTVAASIGVISGELPNNNIKPTKRRR